jgi:hypothetical protein
VGHLTSISDRPAPQPNLLLREKEWHKNCCKRYQEIGSAENREGEMTMKKVGWIAFISLLVLPLIRESYAADRFQASLNFLMAYPQNDFKTNLDRTFYGLSGEFFFRLQRSPFLLGVSLEYLNYGSETRTEPWSADVPEVWIDVITRNSIFSAAAVVRVSPIEGPFCPYVEGLIGFNYIFTYTSIRDADSWLDDIATTTNFDDWALTYGAGAGAILRALDVCNRQGRSVFSLYLEIGLRYLKGGTAEYLRKNSIFHDNGSLTYTPSVSTTDLMKTHLGVTFRF